MPEPAAPRPARAKRVALVIGSGNLKCVAALGLMKVLAGAGITVDMAVGCSGGSIYAATVALGYTLDQVADLTAHVWTREVYTHYNYRALLHILLPGVFRSQANVGLLDDRQLLQALRSAFGDHTFAQTRIPLYMVATDVDTGEKVILEEGSIVDAIRASVSMPIIYPPWPVNHRLLIDGGAVDPLPVDVAIREGADVIIAMAFANPVAAQSGALVALARQSSNIMMNNLIQSTYAFYNLAHHAEIILVAPEFNRPIGLSDTHLFPYLIEEGERAAEEQLPYLRQLLAASAS